MSRMVGIHYLDGRPVSAEDLDCMLGATAFPGGDVVGTWRKGPVGLGNRALQTTPESLHERMPLQRRNGRLVLTADARIDNRQELAAALRLRLTETLTDGDLILAAYEKWGDRCAERLVGDFAFALWDDDRQVLFCARDPIGLKPFYYYHCPGRMLVLASQVKPITSLPDVPGRLNEERVADYLGDILQDSTITFQRDILRLPPAHAMVATKSGLVIRRYWALDPEYELKLASDEEYTDAFHDLFMEVMRCHMRSTGRAGSTLSGGLDSSTIACAAARLFTENGDNRWPTFTAVYEATPQGDERSYINAVTAHADTEPHFIYSDRIGPFAHYDEMYRHVDEPTDNPFSSIGWELRRLIRDCGTRVLLDGTGGDMTVAFAFCYLTDLARSMDWVTLRREVSDLAKRFYGSHRSQLRIWRRWVIRPFLPETVFRLARRLGGRDVRQLSINVPLVPEFARRVNFRDRLNAQHEGFRATRSAKQDHIYGFEHGMLPWAMEFADKAATAFGCEWRYPFFDKRLIEFCVALPREQRIKNGWTRLIVRRAMQGILPEQVQWRGDKGNPNPNFALALLRHERATLDDVILGSGQAMAAYVDVAALRKVYERFLATQRVRDAYIVWPAVTLELWLRSAGLKP